MSELDPITREEYFYEAIKSGILPTITPITRQEIFLYQIAEKIASGGGGGSVSWNDLTDKPFEFTADDAGKFVKVDANGLLIAESIPAAEEAMF